MSQIVPYMSPLRFHSEDKQIDYLQNYPTPDLMKLRMDYQRGIYSNSFYPDFNVNETISLEVFQSSIESAVIRNINTGATQNMNIIEITPSGWTGTKIWKIEQVVGVGFYRIEIDLFNIGVIYSDEFTVKDWSSTKDLVKIKYYDTLNSNGGVFYDNTTLLWQPIVFYTGNIKKGATQFDKKVYNDQPNNTTVLKNTPKIIDKLTITDIHEVYYDNISYQFSCDTVFANGTQYAVEEIGEPTKIDEKSVLINVEISLSRNTNNGFQQIS